MYDDVQVFAATALCSELNICRCTAVRTMCDITHDHTNTIGCCVCVFVCLFTKELQ